VGRGRVDLAGELFGLVALATDIEDHPDNATRFVVVARERVAAPTGHDRTTIVCFQDSDRPGSLYGILGRFAARDINLTKLESRPTKRGLGDYCFVIEFEGHVADDVVADCLADLQTPPRSREVLGSYRSPGGSHGSTRKRSLRLDDRRISDERDSFSYHALRRARRNSGCGDVLAGVRDHERRGRRHRRAGQ